MKRWMLPAAAMGLLTLTFGLAVSRWMRPGPGGNAALEKPVKLLTISATIDGSGRFIFTTNSVRLENRHYNAPTDVIFDGEPWTDLKATPPRWLKVAPELDLPRARIVQRRGRDLLALEPTAEGFDLFYSDTPMGSAAYVVTIAIPRR